VWRCASLSVQLRLAATADARFSDRPLDACNWAFALATMHCKWSSPADKPPAWVHLPFFGL